MENESIFSQHSCSYHESEEEEDALNILICELHNTIKENDAKL